jgi:Zn-dependent protease
MREHVRLGRIAGIAVGFNWTLLVIAGLLAFGLGGNRFPADAPGYTKLAYGMAGLLTALAFLAGLLAHELSHALVARHEGLKVDGIVLWLMGGYTRISEDPKTPGSEFRISAAGPFVSLLVGIGCALAALIGEQVGLGRLPVDVLIWLGSINILLAVFNMLPGAPLDGGKVLHAAVWARTGNRYKASRISGRGGRVVGAAVMTSGLVLVATGHMALIDAVWFGFVGWFLIKASQAEETNAVVQQSLDGLRAADVMTPSVVGPGWFTVDAFLREFSGSPRPPAYLVEQWGGGIAGVVPTASLEAVPALYRGTVRAVDSAILIPQLPVFPPDAAAGQVVGTMAERDANWALVVASERIVGILSLETIPLIADHVRQSRPATVSATAAVG